MQLVVHEQLEIMKCSLGLYKCSLTPIKTVKVLGGRIFPSALNGAERSTLRAPAKICCAASCGLVNLPVDSITKSTFRSFQGNFVGSFSARTRIFFLLMIKESSVNPTSSLKEPCRESCFRRWARVFVSVKSLIPTKLILRLFHTALRIIRPMRPK